MKCRALTYSARGRGPARLHDEANSNCERKEQRNGLALTLHVSGHKQTSILKQHLAILGQGPQVVLNDAFQVIRDLSHGRHRGDD